MKKIVCISFLLLAPLSVFAQWIQTSGPSGGGVSDFAFVGGKILAATFDLGNGVFASTDSGFSWHESGLQGMMLTKISAFNNTVITATTQNSYNETDAIYRSSDAGNTWQSVLSVPNINGIRSICHYQERWFLSAQGQEGGLYVSTDDGVSWIKNIPALFNFSNPVPLLSFGKYLLAGTDVVGTPALIRSQDGQTWIQSTHGFDSIPLRQIYSGMVSGNTIWLGVVGGGIFSTDSGYSWQHPANLNLEHPQDEYIASLVASGNHSIGISSLNAIYYSWDGDSTWTKVSGNGLPANASYFFSVALNNGSYFLGSSSGIMWSQNEGANWQYSTNGLRAASISALASNGNKIFVATERGVSYTANAGSTWHDPQNLADLNDVPISGFLNGSINFYAYGSGIYSFSGSSWNTIDTNAVKALIEGASGRLIASRESDDPIAGTGGLFKSDNGSANWDSLLTFTNTFDTEYYFLPHCLASHGSSIVAVQRAIVFQAFTDSYFVYRSSDNGTSWQESQIANSPTFVNFADGAFYMGTNDGGLFRSDDEGLTWIPIGFNSKSGVTSLLKIGFWLYATVSGNGNIADGLYKSGDGGTSWQFANAGTYNIMGPLAADGTYLYSGGPSVWKRRLSELGVTDAKAIAQRTTLECYPNPSGDIIHLHINSTYPLDGMLLIADEKGNIVMKLEINMEGNLGDIVLSLGSFAEGAYYARVMDISNNVIAKTHFVLTRK